MFKKIKYLLDNYETIKKIVDEYERDKESPTVEVPKTKKHKRVSIAGVPEEQKKYIQDNFKIDE